MKILRPAGRHPDEIRLSLGDELALVCEGAGDPEPSIAWRRLRKRMPDGRDKIKGSQIIFKNVTRKHAGTYVCEGSNGPGETATDTIKVNVIRRKSDEGHTLVSHSSVLFVSF